MNELNNDLPFSQKKKKKKKKIENWNSQKLGAKLHDKTEYVIHIRNLKQALNHGLAFKKIL